jgi:hypothetical protein
MSQGGFRVCDLGARVRNTNKFCLEDLSGLEANHALEYPRTLEDGWEPPPFLRIGEIGATSTVKIYSCSPRFAHSGLRLRMKGALECGCRAIFY